MTNPVLSLIAAVARQSKADFMRKTRRIEAVQTQFLQTLLRSHQDTEFGREHGLSEIKTIEQFQQRIPVQSYSYYAPYTQRMAEGETNILTPDPLIYFNLSSGSTGQPKLIPVTKRSRRAIAKANRAAMGFVADAALRDKRAIGKLLFTLSVQPLGYTKSGIAYAPVSTSDLRFTDRISRQLFTYPFEVFQVADSAARTYLCLLFALRNANLRIISATLPVLALRLCDTLDQNASDLIEDLETGTIANWLKLEPELRFKFERQLTPMPDRAAQLRRALKTEGRLLPKDAWANLSFIATARGGTSDFYFERFPEFFGDTPIFGGTYACAEGVLGVHRDFNTDSVFPAIESSFIEFIPENQWEVESPKTLLPWEVKVGDRYRIALSNYSGFYRYDQGDVVEIAGFMERSPLMIFRHRCGSVMSSSTEKTTEFHAIQTMQRLQQTFDVSLENFCITLSEDKFPAHYLVNIELTSGSTLDDPEKFLRMFDLILKEIQTFYEIKRRDQIPPPRLRILAPGSFAQLRQRMLQRGVAEDLLKFPHLSEDRSLLAGLTVDREVRLPEDV